MLHGCIGAQQELLQVVHEGVGIHQLCTRTDACSMSSMRYSVKGAGLTWTWGSRSSIDKAVFPTSTSKQTYMA